MRATLIVVLVVLASAYPIFRLIVAFRLYLKLRGKRLVVCPATEKPAATEVAAATVAMKSLVGPLRLRLSECSCWPERQNCGQACVSQIEAGPEECLVRTTISEWYEGQRCVYCQKLFGKMEWHDHKHALIDVNRKSVQWDEISAESLPDVLQTHLPVCWNCHIAQTFRREHQELVMDRPIIADAKREKS